MTLKVIQPSTGNSNADLLLSDTEREIVKTKTKNLGIRFTDAKSRFGEKKKSTFFGCPGGILTGVVDVN